MAKGEAPPAAAAPVAGLPRRLPLPQGCCGTSPAAAPAANDEGFVPVAFSFDDFGDEDEAVIEHPSYDVVFKPKSELYTKGNEATLLLRDLSRLGEMSIHCNMDSLPSLDQMDPETAYFSWKVLDQDRQGRRMPSVRCSNSPSGIAILKCDGARNGRGFSEDAGDELPMQPVPFDLSALDDEP